MSGREDLLRATKAAYDFSVKVVDNAHALLEHSRAGKTRIHAGVKEIRGNAERDVAALDEIDECKTKALNLAETAEAEICERDEAFAKLRARLDDLAATELPPWLPSSADEDKGDNQGSLLDFVDVQGIENLRQSTKQVAADALQEVQEVRAAAEGLTERRRAVRERDMVRAVRGASNEATAPTTTEAVLDNGEQDGVLNILNEWVRAVSTEVDDQGAIVKVLSRGSLGLAGLYDHLLDASELGPPDAQLVRPVRNFLMHDFSASATPGASSQQATGPVPTAPVAGEDSESQESNEDLRKSIAKCEAHMKRGLKKMAVSVDRVKTVSLALTQARRRYPVEARAAVEAALEEARAVVARGESLPEACREAQREVELASQEFAKLDEFYCSFQQAQAQAETELRRRWESLAKVEELAREHQAKMIELVEAEVAARASFDEKYGVYLPDGYCSALRPKAEPTSFQYVIVNADDAHNLHDCTQHLSDLQAASFSAVTDEGVPLESVPSAVPGDPAASEPGATADSSPSDHAAHHAAQAAPAAEAEVEAEAGSGSGSGSGFG